MGRLTELFDIVENGFGEPEQYHWIEPENESVREELKLLRRLNRIGNIMESSCIEPMLF